MMESKCALVLSKFDHMSVDEVLYKLGDAMSDAIVDSVAVIAVVCGAVWLIRKKIIDDRLARR